MRTQEVKIAGKRITVNERTLKELKELTNSVMSDVDRLKEAESVSDIGNVIVDMLKEKICIIFPELSPCEVEESFPSEIEELIKAFVDVNFFGLKQGAMSLLKLVAKN